MICKILIRLIKNFIDILIYLPGTPRTDTLDDILRLFLYEAFRQGDRGDTYMGKTEGAVTLPTGDMDMSLAMAGVVQMADTVFLGAGTVVDVMQQMRLREQGKGTEQGGAVDSRQSGFQVA